MLNIRVFNYTDLAKNLNFYTVSHTYSVTYLRDKKETLLQKRKMDKKRPGWLDRLKKEILFYIWNYEFTCNSINRYTIIDDTSLKFY